MADKALIFIERQKNYTKQNGTYGPFGSISANGCGAVALYNVLNYFGIRMDFMTIVNRFNRLWPIATACGGVLGTNVSHLLWELHRLNFKVRPLIFTKNAIENFRLDEDSAFILLYYWRKNRKLGGHYQAGFGNSDGMITLHNPKVTYQGIGELLQEKKRKEKMWFSLALVIHRK